MEKAEGKTFKFPNVIIILLCMMLLAMVATWVIPSGEYERVENSNGQMLVVPDSYSKTESSPVGLFTVFKAIPEGLTEAGMIAWTILIIGGTWQVLNTTGSISMGIEKMLHKLGKREFIIITFMILIYAMIVSFFVVLDCVFVFV